MFSVFGGFSVKSKIRYIVPIIILLCLPLVSLTGCTFAKEPAAAPASPYYTKAEVDNKVSSALNTVAENFAPKKDTYTKKEVDDAIKDAVKDSGGSGYTNAQVDAKFTTFISNLSEADLTLLKTKLGVNNNSSSGDTITDDELVDSNKSLSLYLTDLNPSMDTLFVNGQENVWWEFAIKNTDTKSHEYEISIYLHPDRSNNNYGFETDEDVESIIVSSDTSLVVTVSQGHPFSATETSKPIILTGKGWIGKSDTIDFRIRATIKEASTIHTSGIEFSFDYDIRQIN